MGMLAGLFSALRASKAQTAAAKAAAQIAEDSQRKAGMYCIGCDNIVTGPCDQSECRMQPLAKRRSF